jgi:cell pole-organizing protein PopZ
MAPEPPPEVLDLTEDMTAMAEVPAFRTIDSEPDVVFAEPEPEPEASAPEPEPLPEPPPVSAERLLSGSATAAVDSAFNSLAQTVLLHNARTLEDLVREMLRPMLKTWLDDNLPGMVERLVRAEIERVSRGRS